MLGDRFSAEVLENILYLINEAHKQYSLLDTIFTIMFSLDLQESIYKKVKKTYYVSAGFAGRHVEGFGDLSIDVLLQKGGKGITEIIQKRNSSAPLRH